MAFKESIEKEFLNEIYEKKQHVYNTKAKTGRGSRRSTRGMRTEYDFMSKKERDKLNSEVRVSSLNDIVLPKEEFDTLAMERQKELLIHWRDLYENKYIMEQMGVKGSNTFHRYIKDLEIPKKARGGTRNTTGRRRKAATTIKKETAPQISLQFEEPTIQDAIIENSIQQPINSVVQTVVIDGLHLEYNGIYDAEQLSKIFTKLQLITDGEECKFQLNISLSEKPI